jgi:hypothetical protein
VICLVCEKEIFGWAPIKHQSGVNPLLSSLGGSCNTALDPLIAKLEKSCNKGAFQRIS